MADETYEPREGDRVRVKGYGAPYDGLTGTVRFVPGGRGGWLDLRVVLDEDPDPMHGGLPVSADEIEPLTEGVA